MTSFFKALPLAVALAAGFAAGAAQATTFTQVTPLTATPSVHVFAPASGSFFDTYNFSVSSASLLSGAANNLPLSLGFLNVLNITGLTVNVWDNHHPSGLTNFGSFAGNNNTYTFNLPAAGDYHVDITGTATGLAGGSYAVTLSAAPVPEPETYAMLLAGLGVMGAIARRRKAA